MEFLSGCFSGLIQNLIGHPFDTIKVLQQNNKSFIFKNPLNYYKGLQYPTITIMLTSGINFDILNRINNKTNEYFISGMISGLVTSPVHFLFDYFKIKTQMGINKYSFYDMIKTKGKITTILREGNAMSIYYGSYYYLKNKKEYSSLYAGSLSGMFSWLLTYPFDIIRTRQMAYNIKFIQAVKLGSLYKGLSICLLRAGIVNSSAFYSYEFMYYFLQNNN